MGNRLAGVVTRAVVLTTSWRLCGPLFKLVNEVPLGKVNCAPVGAPEADNVTVSGKFPVGVTVTVKGAGIPAGTVAVSGETATLKLFTTATAGGGAGVTTVGVPKILTFPPSLTEPGWGGVAGSVGASTTVTVATAPPFKVPTVQVTVLLVTGAGQLDCPGTLLAETKVALDGMTSVKMIPVVRSPLLVIL